LDVPLSGADKPSPIVFGCKGTELTANERKLFKLVDPFGFILFKRNCVDADQVRYLIRELRQAVGRTDAPILIDQEGGRVCRLGPPHWPKYPAARTFGVMYERDPAWGTEAMQLYARILANELAQLNITIDCAPVLDLFIDGASAAIGDRALSRQPTIVAALARLWSETFLQNGVLPVIKHFPGHGRVKTDPHHALPVIGASYAELASEDFVPFDFLKDMPIGMNSHAVFLALDPGLPASMSAKMCQEIIRGTLCFDGLLLSDDLTMKALNGTPSELVYRALEAGADIALHCNGNMDEMEDIARILEPMDTLSWERWDHAKSMVNSADPAYQPKPDIARLDVLLGGLAYEDKSTP
jgi:beta-N-acetylhexosaminidase